MMTKDNSEKLWCVYCHRNLINDKRYFGITSQTVNQRWRHGLGYKRNEHFNRAIQKYGWENFEHIIIEENLSRSEACKKEIELIKEYDTTNQDKGYNLSSGGEGGSGHHTITDEWRKSHLEACAKPVYQYDLSMDFVAKYPSILEAERQTGVGHEGISHCCLHRDGAFTTGGYIWFYESEVPNINKEEVLSKVKNKRSTPVVQFTMDMKFIKEFESTKQASEETGVDVCRIRSCACSTVESYSANGYIWIYKKDYLKMLSGEIPMRQPHSSGNRRRVKQFTKDMEFIQEFESINEAARAIERSPQYIMNNCRGKSKTAYGYIWKYAEEVA